ncbi:MAG: ABC transporter permease [Tenuifilaceae bacterium]
MKNIIKLEFLKTLSYPAFRTIIILHAVLFLMVVTISAQIELSVQGIRIDKLFAFPNVWSTFAWIGSWFNLLLGIITIMLVGNEHQFRTFRKQIIDGVKRNHLLLAKMSIVLTLSLYAMVLVFITGLIFGLIYTDQITIAGIFEKFYLVLVLFIQSFAYMMLGMLFAFIFKNNALSIVTFILFFFPVEPILRAFFPSSIDNFFPIKIISNLTPMPDFVGITTSDLIQINGASPASMNNMPFFQESLSIGTATLACIVYIGIFYFLSRLIVEKRSF